MKTLSTILLFVFICIPWQMKGEDLDTRALLSVFYESGYTLPSDIEEQDVYIIDGVLFGKNTLLLYPEWITNKHYFVPQGIEFVFDSAFYGNRFIESVTIPSSCRVFGNRSFGDCFSLHKIVFDEGNYLLIIDDYCFSGCHNLQIFEFPQSLYFLGDEAFAETGLSMIRLPRNIRHIGDRAFIHTHVRNVVFDPLARPRYLGNEWIELPNTGLITIILPFDADINQYFQNPSYITQMENVELLRYSDEYDDKSIIPYS